MSKTHDRRQAQTLNLPPDNFLPLQEIARQTDLNPSTLARWARDGKVIAQREGKIWYLDIHDIQKVTGQVVTVNDLRPLREIVSATGVPASTLRRWAQDGRVEAEKVDGHGWHVSLDDARRVSRTLKPGKHCLIVHCLYSSIPVKTSD